jgi:hypothetical protein
MTRKKTDIASISHGSQTQTKTISHGVKSFTALCSLLSALYSKKTLTARKAGSPRSQILHYSFFIANYSFLAPPPPANEQLRINNEKWLYYGSGRVFRDLCRLSVFCSAILVFSKFHTFDSITTANPKQYRTEPTLPLLIANYSLLISYSLSRKKYISNKKNQHEGGSL